MPPFVVGPSAIIVAPPGSSLAGIPIIGPPPYYFAATPITASVLVTAQILPESGFQMPDFYNFWPNITRQQDIEFVDRGDAPVYFWDSVPSWDTLPFRWDEVIGPETILKTTTRIIQLSMERELKDIQNVSLLYNLRRCPREFLPYHAAMLGTPLPAGEEIQQRSFLQELVATYKKKGTPLSFFRLFEQIGFDLTLAETYQRKRDAAEVPGPQMALKSNTLIVDEPVGTTVLGQVTYRMSTLNSPITKGTLKLEIFAYSATDPLIVVDNGDGGWSDNFAGSINYRTGNIEITLLSTPSLNGQPIKATYNQRIDPYPDLDEVMYTDRYRSSVVKFAIKPKNPGVSLTTELIDRIELYLQLLKPAHVIIRNLDLILELDDTEDSQDDLNPHTIIFVESLFGTLYLGAGWANQVNGSRDPNSTSFPQDPHRAGPEFLTNPAVFGGDCPYVYPWFVNGIFTQPKAANLFEADWFPMAATASFSSSITNDLVPTTTNFAILKGAGTALGVGDHLAVEDGPAGGEASIITFFVDSGTYYDVTVSPALDVAPVVADLVRVIDIDAVNMRNLKTGYRQQDPLDIYFGESLAPAPDGLSVGPFTVGLTHTPILAGSTSFLRFTIGGNSYEETAAATGPFTNLSGLVAASNIDYGTGVVSVTFTAPPDALTQVEVFSTISGAKDAGEY